MNGRLIDLAVGMDGKQRVTIALDGDMRESYDALRETDVSVEIKKARRKRSLDANAYAWVLIDRIAAALRVGKVEVYRELIRSIGGVSETVCVKNEAVSRLCEGWRHNGLGWFSEPFPSRISGCTNVILFYGSSTYDTKQMSALIDAAVESCKALNIETMPPAELAALEASWSGAQARAN